MKMFYYKLVKITIDVLSLSKLIFNVVMRHYGLLDLILSDCSSVLTSKFWLLLYYFLEIKRKYSTTSHPKTDGQIKRQNSIMEAYLRAFVNFKQNDLAELLPMAELAYNNAKNASTGHTLFELNCDYYSHIFYKEDVNPRSKSKLAEELLIKLRELMTVYWENLHLTQKL